MKFETFLKLLNKKEKLFFVIGRLVEKISQAQLQYQKIKAHRNFLSNIESDGFKQSFQGEMLTLQKNGNVFQLRKVSSDYDVFKQVYLNNEYQPVIDCLIDNKIELHNIIDAGSNIGLTTAKLLEYFPNANIICIEPDPNNFVQLTKNLNKYLNVKFLPAALWGTNELLSLDFHFRDRRDWSRTVTEYSSSSKIPVKGITINTILDEFSLETVDLLKMDIEGGEANIFSNKNNLSFLNKVKVIAIEIHDELNCRQKIYEILLSYNFKIFNSGELTIGIKSNV